VDSRISSTLVSKNNQAIKKAKHSIKDLERLSGVKAHTIRIWEQRYNLLSPSRTETNIRFYTDNDLKLLLNIAQLINSGAKISHLSRLTEKEIENRIHAIEENPLSSNQYFNTQIDNLIIAMSALNDHLFEDTIKLSSQRYGFEKTMIELIIPFLNKVGLMWRTGEIGVIQEHFISNLIRQKILVAIDGIPKLENIQDETYLLFLPEGELHEMGLLFSNYLLKSKGKKVIYLGQAVPLEDVTKFCHEFQPKYLLTFFTATYKIEVVENYLLDLLEIAPEINLLIAGNQLKETFFENNNRIRFLKNPGDLNNVIENGMI
jgi:DNA-binding transcriptional MerR regulator